MDPVLFEIKKGIGLITFNRPDKLNSFTREMTLLFQQYLTECATDSSIRCVYITGKGKAFSVGQDLGELIGENALSFEKILPEHYNPIITKIREMEKPVVAAVNGVAAGAGANIALCCDIVVATRSATFIQAFSKIGLIPDSSGTFFLPRLIGFQRASAIMMLGDKIPAPDAEKMGMIYKCFEDADFVNESYKIAETLSAMPTRGLAFTKRALNESMSNNLADQLKLEDELQFAAGHTDDYREGVAAFLEKRKPVFKGQ